MAVAIPFTADLTEVRAQLDRLVADARATKIPVGGSFAAGVSGGGGASTPTVQGIFGGSAGSVAGGFGAGIGSPFGGGGGPLGAGGFFSAGPTGVQVFGYPGSPATATGTGAMAVAAPSGATVVMPNAGGGGGGASGSGGGYAAGILGSSGGGRFLGLSTSGLGRYVGAAFIGREALRAGQLSSDYNEQVALAGNDQRSILKAEQSFQKGVGSFPIVGQAAELIANSIAESSGFGRIGTEATLRSADAQEEGVSLRRQFGRQSQRLRDEILATSQSGSYDRDVVEGEASHRERLQSIADKNNDILASDRKRRGDEAIGLESTRYARVKEASGRLPGFFPNWAVDALGYGGDVASQQIDDAKTISDERAQDSAGAKKRSDAERAAENQRFEAESSRRFTVANRSNFTEGSALAGAASVYRAIAGNREPDFVERKQIENEVAQSNLKALSDPNMSASNRALTIYGNQQRLDADAQQRSNRKYEEENRYNDDLHTQRQDNMAAKYALTGQPLDALIESNNARRSRALSGLDPLADADLFDATNEEFDLREKQLRKDDATNLKYEEKSLSNRGNLLDIALKNDVYGNVASRALDISQSAALEAAILGEDKSGRNDNKIKKVLENAGKEEQLLGQNFLNRFKPEEFNPNRTASGSISGSEVEETLKTIADNTAAIKAAAENWGKAQ